MGDSFVEFPFCPQRVCQGEVCQSDTGLAIRRLLAMRDGNGHQPIRRHEYD
jgi:hypothetical protein